MCVIVTPLLNLGFCPAVIQLVFRLDVNSAVTTPLFGIEDDVNVEAVSPV